MIELELGLVADAAQVDNVGKLSILGEFRYLFATQVPATHQSMSLILRIVASRVEVEGKECQLRLKFVDEDGNDVFPKNPPALPLRFGPIGPADRGRWQTQLILNMGLVPLPVYGQYTVHVLVNEQHAGEVRFFVMKPPAQASGPVA